MKTLKNAGISIILLVVVSAISLIAIASKIVSSPLSLSSKEAMMQMIVQEFPAYLLFLGTAISIILIIFLYAGFIKLGKITKNDFLVIISWIIPIVLILGSIKEVLFNYLIYYRGIESQLIVVSQFMLNLTFLFLIVVLFILLGVALIKIKDKIEMAKIIGIFYIISGATTIILIGSVLLIVTQLIAIVMFFKASKEFEK